MSIEYEKIIIKIIIKINIKINIKRSYSAFTLFNNMI